MNAKDEAREQLRRLVDEGLIKTTGHAQRREDALDAYAAAAVAEARAPLVEALRAVEWHRGSAKWGTITTDVCPSCGETEIEGHTPDCPLAAALAAKETP